MIMKVSWVKILQIENSIKVLELQFLKWFYNILNVEELSKTDLIQFKVKQNGLKDLLVLY